MERPGKLDAKILQLREIPSKVDTVHGKVIVGSDMQSHNYVLHTLTISKNSRAGMWGIL